LRALRTGLFEQSSHERVDLTANSLRARLGPGTFSEKPRDLSLARSERRLELTSANLNADNDTLKCRVLSPPQADEC